MPIGILNNIASLSAENQLSVTNTQMQSVLYQLSSGSRINSGADDAAGLAIANGLEANVTALTQSEQNANDGVGQLQVADGALAQVTTLLNRAVTLATESANGTVSDSQRTAIDAEFTQIKAEIDQIGSNTTYNGAQVFAGGSVNANQVSLAPDTAADTPGLASTISGTLKVTLGGASAAGTAYTFGTGDATLGDLVNEINNSASQGTATTGLIASVDGSGNLVITDTQSRGTTATGGAELAVDASGLTVGAMAAGAYTGTNTNNASNLSIYLSDSTVAGSGTISVAMSALSSSNLNGASVSGDNLASMSSATSALTDINTAIAQVAALRGQIGAGINRLQSASNVISSQTQNLTSAENTIMAADVPTTVANLTKYSILEQTGISALAQANQQQQLVLKLLQ
jgi:flagellin